MALVRSASCLHCLRWDSSIRQQDSYRMQGYRLAQPGHRRYMCLATWYREVPLAAAEGRVAHSDLMPSQRPLVVVVDRYSGA